MESKNKIQVSILGHKFNIVGIETQEYLNLIAEYIDEKMKEAKAKGHASSEVEIAILAAINVADHYFKSNDQLLSLQEAYNKKVKKLNDIKELYEHNKSKQDMLLVEKNELEVEIVQLLSEIQSREELFKKERKQWEEIKKTEAEQFRLEKETLIQSFQQKEFYFKKENQLIREQILKKQKEFAKRKNELKNDLNDLQEEIKKKNSEVQFKEQQEKVKWVNQYERLRKQCRHAVEENKIYISQIQRLKQDKEKMEREQRKQIENIESIKEENRLLRKAIFEKEQELEEFIETFDGK